MRYIPQIIMWWILSIQLVFANVDTYQTKKGDTLLKIAAKLREDFEEELTKEQLALALYQNNSQAFQSCNIFTLKIGAKLQISSEMSFLDPKTAANDIKHHQQQWKATKGKIEKLVCEKPPLPKQILPKIEPSTEAVILKESSPSPLSEPLSAILTVPFKPLIPDFYSIDLINNLQDLPSLELIRITPFEELPLSTKSWEWWHILITLSGFLWGFWLLFVNRMQLTENKGNFHIATPQVLEIATLDTDNPISAFNTVKTQSEEHQEEPLYAITSSSFESILKETLQNWGTPVNSIVLSNTEEILSNEEVAQWTTNEPVIDRQMLEKIFQLN